MHGYLELNTYHDRDSNRVLLRELKTALDDAATTGPLTKDRLDKALRMTMQKHTEIREGVAVEGYLSEYGFFYGHFYTTPHLTFFLSPILDVTEGCKLLDHSRTNTGYISTADGAPIIYTRASLGNPFWSTEVEGKRDNFTSCMAFGNLFFLTHAMRRLAKNASFFVQCMEECRPNFSGTNRELYMYVGYGCFPCQCPKEIDWDLAHKIVSLQWLDERFCRGQSQSQCTTWEADDKDFVNAYVAEMKRRVSYHEVAGHYRDELNGDGTLDGSSAIGEARAGLAQLAFSDCPLYGIVELIGFVCSSNSQYSGAHSVLNKLMQKLGFTGSICGSLCDMVLKCAEGLHLPEHVFQLRQASLELLEHDFSI